MRDSELGDAMRRPTGDVLARDPKNTRGRRDGAADRARERRLAGAVGAEYSDGLAFANSQVDSLENAGLTVAGAYPLQLEQRSAPATAL